MGWTPPSKFMVILTFVLMAFGIFILFDQEAGLWPSFLPGFALGTLDGWVLISVILFFLTWFLFFLAVKLKGL
ncbi:MAG: hypothetical protein JSV23_02150 [Promethearchaeota archaeon]|nr:MAG: hypothetical protein JSV23_02150 [Candidatus Lokiarchaeota archaeon]